MQPVNNHAVYILRQRIIIGIIIIGALQDLGIQASVYEIVISHPLLSAYM